MSKTEKIKNFNPNDIGDVNANLFGLPFDESESELVVIPVPWEVTVSYGGGTANGPAAIFEASFQVDLFDPMIKDAWKFGFFMRPEIKEIREKSNSLRGEAENYINKLAEGINANEAGMKSTSEKILNACEWLNSTVEKEISDVLNKNKIPVLLGGDHSTPLGMIKALGKKHSSFGILQLDAHADLRIAYEGFTYSHASIMYNALKEKPVEKLVQVGIRDYCEEEFDQIQNSNGRIKTFFDRDIKYAQYCGDHWDRICNRIIAELPQKVYLSFDIDALDPKLCPNTGTPVAGGFETEEILFLIEKIVKSGKQIIAFDINEVCPGENEWDANVAARLLYRIGCRVALSNGIKA